MKLFFKIVFSVSTGLMVALPSQSYNMNMTPPGSKKLMDAQASRLRFIREYKAAGYIGESETSMLAVRSLRGVPKKKANKIKKIVAAENSGRVKILALLARANKLDKKGQDDLRVSFYKVYKNTSAKGSYYYEDKAWRRKAE